MLFRDVLKTLMECLNGTPPSPCRFGTKYMFAKCVTMQLSYLWWHGTNKVIVNNVQKIAKVLPSSILYVFFLPTLTFARLHLQNRSHHHVFWIRYFFVASLGRKDLQRQEATMRMIIIHSKSVCMYIHIYCFDIYT